MPKAWRLFAGPGFFAHTKNATEDTFVAFFVCGQWICLLSAGSARADTIPMIRGTAGKVCPVWSGLAK